MVRLEDVKTTDESTDEDTEDDSDDGGSEQGSSHAYLFIAGSPAHSERPVTTNTNPYAQELLKSGGKVYDAMDGASTDGTDWRKSDVISHVVVAYEDIVDAGYEDPKDMAKVGDFISTAGELGQAVNGAMDDGYMDFDMFHKVVNASIGAMESHLTGDTASALGLFDASAAEIAEHVASRDDVDADDLHDELAALSEDD